MKTVKTYLVSKFNRIAVSIADEKGKAIKYVYEFAMFRTFMLYQVPPIRFRGEMCSGHVDLEVYGLTVRKIWYEGGQRKQTEYDLDQLSTQQYQINSLLQLLCRPKTIIPSIDLRDINRDETCMYPDDFVRSVAKDQAASWNRNDWGNPFGKVAETLLREKLRQEAGISFPPLAPQIELKDKRRNPLARLYSGFSSGPNNDKGVGM